MQNTFDALWAKHTSYSVGEELFGLEHTEQVSSWQCIVITIIEQAGLNLIKKELNLLQRLYKLYNDVINSVNGYITNLNEDSSSSSLLYRYFTILWKEVDVEYINNELMDFSNR